MDGEAERGIDWGERGLRLSPFDPWAFAAFHSLATREFPSSAATTEAAKAAYKAVQRNPAHSISYMLLAASLAKLGRLEEAKAAAARVLELQPAFHFRQPIRRRRLRARARRRFGRGAPSDGATGMTNLSSY